MPKVSREWIREPLRYKLNNKTFFAFLVMEMLEPCIQMCPPVMILFGSSRQLIWEQAASANMHFHHASLSSRLFLRVPTCRQLFIGLCAAVKTLTAEFSSRYHWSSLNCKCNEDKKDIIDIITSVSFGKREGPAVRMGFVGNSYKILIGKPEVHGLKYYCVPPNNRNIWIRGAVHY
jgi:hypothetical protein